MSDCFDEPDPWDATDTWFESTDIDWAYEHPLYAQRWVRNIETVELPEEDQ